MTDFCVLMPGHKLVIDCARVVNEARATDEHDETSVELLASLVSLEMAFNLLDAGDHGRAREILEGKSGG